MKLYGRYCTNYNGMSLTINVGGEQVDLDDLPQYKEASSKCTDQICDTLIEDCDEDCDEDGEYQGDESHVIEVVTKAVNQHFGDQVEVEVELDDSSS